MTNTAAIAVTAALLICIAALDARFGGGGALLNGCIIGVFFGSLIESKIKSRDN
jgi:hypothetical protein